VATDKSAGICCNLKRLNEPFDFKYDRTTIMKPSPRPTPRGESLPTVLAGLAVASAITFGGLRLAWRTRGFLPLD
jgi:hypothetical protein